MVKGGGSLSRPTRVVAASRKHDHLYDPVYTCSSMVDHQKILRKQMMGGIVRVPVFENLFSGVATFPSSGYRLSSKQDGPSVTMADLTQAQDQQRHRAQSILVQTTGAQRYLFFNRPLVPFMQSMSSDVILSAPLAAFAVENDPVDVRSLLDADANVIAPGTRTVSVQTMFRETESQTVPYSPDYILGDPNNPPEILHLKSWCPSDGSVPSLQEIEDIERAMAKREFEKHLPEIQCAADFHKRSKLLEQQEMKEWEFRNQQIREVETQRLHLLVKAIRERESERESVMEKRIDNLRTAKIRERDQVLTKIQKKRVHAMRKVNRMRKECTDRELAIPGKADIIQEYSDFSSKVYAPMDRSGKIPHDKEVGELALSGHFDQTKTFESVVNLEATIPVSTMNFVVKPPKKVIPEILKTRKGQAIASDLEDIDRILKSAKAAPEGKEAHSLTFGKSAIINSSQIYAKPDEVHRPATPIAKEALPEHSALVAINRAATVVQKLIRGRATQLRIVNGQRKSIGLIRELALTQALSSASPDLIVPSGVLSSLDKSVRVDHILDCVIGSVLSSTIEYLHKDRIAHAQLDQIKKIVDKATIQRKHREAEQAGSRQKQFIARGKRDQVTRQLDTIVQQSSRLFTDDIISATLQEVAFEEAFQEKPPSNITSIPTADDRQLICQIIDSYILPEVDDKIGHHNQSLKEMSILRAAHDVVFDMFSKLASSDIP